MFFGQVLGLAAPASAQEADLHLPFLDLEPAPETMAFPQQAHQDLLEVSLPYPAFTGVARKSATIQYSLVMLALTITAKTHMATVWAAGTTRVVSIIIRTLSASADTPAHS